MDQPDEAEYYAHRYKALYQNALLVTFIDNCPNGMVVFFPRDKKKDVLRIHESIRTQYNYTVPDECMFELPNAIGTILPARLAVQNDYVESPEAIWLKIQAKYGKIAQLHCVDAAEYRDLREAHIQRALVARNAPYLN